MTDAKPAGADAKFDAKALEIADKIAWEVGNAEVLEYARRLRTEWEKEQAQQEPVAEVHPDGSVYGALKQGMKLPGGTKLYTHPAAAQPGMVSVPQYAGTDLDLYLAGPMRGIPEYNFPAFFDAARSLREQGYTVWSPAEHDVEQDGFNPATDKAQLMIHYMRRDLPQVLNSDAVVVLPGWERSAGANLEVHVAKACGLPIHELSVMLAAAQKEQS